MGGTSSSAAPAATVAARADEGEALLRALVLSAARGTRPAHGDLPPPLERELCQLMDALRPEHLGLRLSDLDRRRGADGSAERLTIRTQIICSTRTFELVVFLFPAGASIPLHDHPQMTVLSKVLYGSLSMKSYDWEEPPSAADLAALTAEIERQESTDPLARTTPPLAPPRAAVRRIDTVLTPEAPTFCTRPSFANVHRFEALTDCAVLDFLTPPYDDDAGRDCHYFAQVECNSSSSSSGGGGGGGGVDDALNSRVILRAAAPPASFIIRGAPYLGPSALAQPDGVGTPLV